MGRIVMAAFVALTGLAVCIVVPALPGPRTAPAAPGPEGRFARLGHEPFSNRGMNSALAIAGRHAYVGSRTDGTHPNSGVMVVDIGDPRHPRVVRHLEAQRGASSRELRVWPDRGLLIVMSIECGTVGHRCPAPQEVRGKAT